MKRHAPALSLGTLVWLAGSVAVVAQIPTGDLDRTLNSAMHRMAQSSAVFKEASSRVGDQALKVLLEHHADERERFARGLEQAIKLQGAVVHADPSPDAAMQALGMPRNDGRNADAEILAKLIEQEEDAIKLYTQALEEKALPENVRQVFGQQLEVIQASRDTLKTEQAARR